MSLKTRVLLLFLAALSVAVLPVMADRTAFRTGWNLFSVEQDVDMGRELSDEIRAVMPMVSSSYASAYLDALGQQLAAHAPGHRFSYQFRIIDDDKINAFALPGGFIYVTSGLIQAAANEPELAGMLAHQIAHVALRHGTQQVSRAYAASVRNANPGTVSVDEAMARLDIAFEPDSAVLKYSVEAERQADLLAAQIMYDARFDPRNVASFLQKIRNEHRTLSSAFFTSHPVVSNRVARVRREVQLMGGVPANLRGDSPDLATAKRHLKGETTTSAIEADPGSDPQLPSSRMVLYRGPDIEFRYPENWEVQEGRDSITVAPAGGIVSGNLAWGMSISTFEPISRSFGTQLTPRGGQTQSTSLSAATEQLLDDLRRSNPNMRTAGTSSRMRVDGMSALAMELTNDSPIGGRERDWLITVLRPDGMMYYFIGAAPQRDFNRYKTTFEQIVASVRFTDF